MIGNRQYGEQGFFFFFFFCREGMNILIRVTIYECALVQVWEDSVVHQFPIDRGQGSGVGARNVVGGR